MGVLPTKKPGSGPHNKPFQPAPGTDIGPVEDVDAKTRHFLARAIASFTATATAVSGIYGLVTADYTAVIAVWAIAAPFIGALVTYYFGPRRNDTG